MSIAPPPLTHPHLSSSDIGGALPGCWALSSTLPPGGTVVGGPVLALGPKMGLRPPLPLPHCPELGQARWPCDPRLRAPASPQQRPSAAPLPGSPVACQMPTLPSLPWGRWHPAGQDGLEPFLSPKLPPTGLSTSPSFLHQVVHLQELSLNQWAFREHLNSSISCFLWGSQEL